MIKLLLKRLIDLYQQMVSPFWGSCCRFEISCSKNLALCLDRYGLFLGLFFGGLQVLKCHPWTNSKFGAGE